MVFLDQPISLVVAINLRRLLPTLRQTWISFLRLYWLSIYPFCHDWYFWGWPPCIGTKHGARPQEDSCCSCCLLFYSSTTQCNAHKLFWRGFSTLKYVRTWSFNLDVSLFSENLHFITRWDTFQLRSCRCTYTCYRGHIRQLSGLDRFVQVVGMPSILAWASERTAVPPRVCS